MVERQRYEGGGWLWMGYSGGEGLERRERERDV